LLQLIDRIFTNSRYLIDLSNNEIILDIQSDINKKRSSIKTIKIDKKLKIDDLRKFITLDFETIKIKSGNDYINQPVLLAYYDFYKNKTDYSLLTKDSNKLIRNILEKFLTKEYNGYKIYAHNLSLFDSVFILKNLIYFIRTN
jgi:hypothetical protein